MIRKEAELTCKEYDKDGNGLCFLSDGKKVTVRKMLPGDKAVISYAETKKDIYLGKIEKIITPSEKRKEPKCPLTDFCGGCQLQHMTYDAQAEWKERKVLNLLQNYPELKDIKVSPILKCGNEYRYRNKVQVAFMKDFHGRMISGFYVEGTNDIIDRKECLLETKQTDEIIDFVKQQFIKLHIEPYDKASHTGCIKNVIVRTSSFGEAMIVIITNSGLLTKKQEFVSAITKRFKMVHSIVQNINPSYEKGYILGEKEVLLFGSPYITDELCGFRFRISSKSFFQVNHDQTEVLYKTAIGFAGLTGKEEVLDAYCGIGTIGLIASSKAKKVTGVEIIDAAIQNAIENAKLNHVQNAEFHTCDATPFILKAEKDGKKYDVVFVDPPRGGCSDAFIQSLMKMKPKKIIYVSCNPETLARDLKKLVLQYTISSVQPMDLFPMTEHVETVVCLSNKNATPKDHVKMGLDAEECYHIRDSKRKF